jgi:hypothetical protein
MVLGGFGATIGRRETRRHCPLRIVASSNAECAGKSPLLITLGTDRPDWTSLRAADELPAARPLQSDVDLQLGLVRYAVSFGIE